MATNGIVARETNLTCFHEQHDGRLFCSKSLEEKRKNKIPKTWHNTEKVKEKKNNLFQLLSASEGIISVTYDDKTWFFSQSVRLRQLKIFMRSVRIVIGSYPENGVINYRVDEKEKIFFFIYPLEVAVMSEVPLIEIPIR